MKHELVPAPARSDPASAFEALRGEVGLLRRALEGLAAERQLAPDYTLTMADQARRLAGIEALIDGFSHSPALQLTPESLAASIARAGETVRAGDRDTLRGRSAHCTPRSPASMRSSGRSGPPGSNGSLSAG